MLSAVYWFYEFYDDAVWVMMGLGYYEVLDRTHSRNRCWQGFGGLLNGFYFSFA